MCNVCPSCLPPQLSGYEGSEPLTLQLFIGTADDRLLRPHAFYQVHRITGKTVSTASHETLQAHTKLLELPLLPENNMRPGVSPVGPGVSPERPGVSPVGPGVSPVKPGVSPIGPGDRKSTRLNSSH